MPKPKLADGWLLPVYYCALTVCAASVIAFDVHGASPAMEVSGAEALGALKQVMRARGLVPNPGSRLSMDDYVSTKPGAMSDQLVGFAIGPDGQLIPTQEWRDYHPEFCKQRSREMLAPESFIEFKVTRTSERLDGAERNQIYVFARLRDAESGKIIEQHEGEATNMTGVDRPDEGDVADALEQAFSKMQASAAPPDSPCGAVPVEHLAGEKVGEDFDFLAGFRGSYGRYLDYTWDFGDGSGPVSVGKNATHVYNAPGTYVVSVEVDGENMDPATGKVAVEVVEEASMVRLTMGEAVATYAPEGDYTEYAAPGGMAMYFSPKDLAIWRGEWQDVPPMAKEMLLSQMSATMPMLQLHAPGEEEAETDGPFFARMPHAFSKRFAWQNLQGARTSGGQPPERSGIDCPDGGAGCTTVTIGMAGNPVPVVFDAQNRPVSVEMAGRQLRFDYGNWNIRRPPGW